MTLKNLCLLLLAALVASVVSQNPDELHIPVENDNQFPPDNHFGLDGSILEGSGGGAIEEPVDATTLPAAPLLEDVQLTSLTDNVPAATKSDTACPKPCVCHIEGDSNNFIVDCSGYSLTEFPNPLDPKTTILNLQNNKLTEIPKEVSMLKNLKILNANNNSIMNLVSGSVSELPELITLKLGNNRLIEFPKDLKNSFGLTKLEELDLGGNDMRTVLTSETFSNFKALRNLTLPTSSASLLEDLCASLKDSLESVCTGSCASQSFECPDAPQNFEDGLLDAILPGTIAITSILDDTDPVVNTENKIDNDKEDTVKPTATAKSESKASSGSSENVSPTEGVSFRSSVNKIPEDVSQLNAVVDVTNEVSNTDTDVAVGATTSDTKTGGVDKSVIGMVVAGMVLVVAGITIKKNWSSIKKRFSSTPRPPNNNAGSNANGTSPEEVPLQEKSPV